MGLNFRRMHRDLFLKGEYVPMDAVGVHRNCVCAFSRRFEILGLWLWCRVWRPAWLAMAYSLWEAPGAQRRLPFGPEPLPIGRTFKQGRFFPLRAERKAGQLPPFFGTYRSPFSFRSRKAPPLGIGSPLRSFPVQLLSQLVRFSCFSAFTSR